MNNRVLKVVALVVALGLVLTIGVVAAGGLVYVLVHADTNADRVVSVASAQAIDPGYGVVVAAVEAGGPAAQAGIVRGDILLEIDGARIENATTLTGALSGLQSGDQATLLVLHGDEQRTLTVILGQQNGRAYLGITLCGGSTAAAPVQRVTSGALITSVVPDSPAAQAGLQQGDEIVSVDGQALDADHNLTDLITSHAPGDQVALEVVQSGGETVTMNVILGQNPDSEGVAYLGVQYTASPRFDLPMNGIMPLPNPGDYQFNQMPFFPPDGRVSQGVIVRGVTAGSPADSAGLKQGDVIAAVDGEPVSSPQALSDAVSGHEPGDRITLTVYRSSDQQVVTIDVTLGPHPDQEGRAYLGVSIGGFFHIQQPGEDDGSGGFELYGQPFDWPFGQDGAPFQFQLPLPPDGSSCNGSPACAGKSA